MTEYHVSATGAGRLNFSAGFCCSVYRYRRKVRNQPIMHQISPVSGCATLRGFFALRSPRLGIQPASKDGSASLLPLSLYAQLSAALSPHTERLFHRYR